MKLVLTLTLGSLLCAVPAKADTFTSTGLTGIFANQSMTAFESIDSTMEFDRTTQTVVPGSVNTASFGALGAFSFSSFNLFVNQPSGPNSIGYLYSFVWGDLGGDTIDLRIANDFFQGESFHWIYQVAISGPGFAGWSDLPFPEPGGVVLFPAGEIATPEPSTLALFGIGLVCIAFMSRRLLFVGR